MFSNLRGPSSHHSNQLHLTRNIVRASYKTLSAIRIPTSVMINTNIEKTREEDEMSDADTAITSDTMIPGFWDDTAIRDAVPWPGETFVIVHKASGRAITQTNGQVRVEADTSTRGCWHWVCVEKDGWLGFFNTASGNYLGHNGKGKIQADVKHHRAYEYFCPRRHPDGGYVLLVTTWDGWKLEKMDVGLDGNDVVTNKQGDEVWEFVKVDSSG